MGRSGLVAEESGGTIQARRSFDGGSQPILSAPMPDSQCQSVPGHLRLDRPAQAVGTRRLKGVAFGRDSTVSGIPSSRQASRAGLGAESGYRS